MELFWFKNQLILSIFPNIGDINNRRGSGIEVLEYTEVCVRKLEIPSRIFPIVYYSGNASRWRERSEYAERYWNLPVVLRCPKTGSFLEYLEMGLAWVKFSKAVYFKILSNLLFKIYSNLFLKTWYLEGICLMYFYVYPKQLNKSCFDRFS